MGFVIVCIPLKDGFAFNLFSKKGIKTFIETKVALKDKVINNISLKVKLDQNSIRRFIFF